MSVNLREKLEKARGAQPDILDVVSKIFAENQAARNRIEANLRQSNSSHNDFTFDFLETDRIFHLDHIRKICIDYRLRFLDSSQFSQGIPPEAISKIGELEEKHQTTLSGFKIAAPSKAFSLENYNDPLLFAPIGNDYYYLIYQWGNDLSSWRKWLVYPLRNLGWFTIFVLLLTALVTWAIPYNRLSDQIPMAGAIIFLFAFKSLFFVLMWGFFMTGRQFNAQAWNSRYYNG